MTGLMRLKLQRKAELEALEDSLFQGRDDVAGDSVGVAWKNEWLPPGFYWIDTTAEKLEHPSWWDVLTDKQPETSEETKFRNDAFRMWLQGMNKNKQNVKVIRKQGNWILFQTLDFVPRWTESFHLGLPHVAPYDADTTMEDVYKLGERETDWKWKPDLEAVNDSLAKVAKWGPPVLLGLAGLTAASIVVSAFRRPQTIRLVSR